MKRFKNSTLACIRKIFHITPKKIQIPIKCDFTYDGINYIILPNDFLEVKVVPSVDKYSGDIVIPPYVEFRGRRMNVTKISRYAFFHCRNLTSINLGNVNQIGNRAFEGCINLKSINFNEVEFIGECAFKGCSSLTSIDFNSVKIIEKKAFWGCVNIDTLDLKNVFSIGDECFVGCKKLDSINFRNVEILGRSVFEDCISLTTLNLKEIESLMGEFVIDDSAKKGVFKNCINLQSVNLDNVQNINDCAFCGCPNITIIKTNRKEPPYITPNAFHRYAFLSTLYVPKGSKSLYQNHDVWNKFSIVESDD